MQFCVRPGIREGAAVLDERANAHDEFGDELEPVLRIEYAHPDIEPIGGQLVERFGSAADGQLDH